MGLFQLRFVRCRLSLFGLSLITVAACAENNAQQSDGTGATNAVSGSGGGGSTGSPTGGTAGTGGVSASGGTSSGGAGGAAGVDASVCGTASENESVSLMCPAGQVMSAVVFASYGTPSGSCGSYATGTCDAASSVTVVEALCLGRTSCSIPATNAAFGDPCNGSEKSLSVEARCAAGEDSGGEPFKGVANSPCAARTALDVSWYYNWTQNENEPCADGRGGEFVPMVWGHTGSEQSADGISNAVASFVSRGYDHVLGFNEPDNSTQSNISVETAIALWPSFDNPAILIGSPGTAANANPGQAWFTDFMARVTANSALRVDFLAIHWYGWNAGSCDADAAQLENYIRWAEGFAGNRPIWITEFGCLNQSAPDMDSVVDFYTGALAVFARHPRIARYAWYPWATNCALNDGDGSLTALGAVYAAAPSHR
jgi:hypothetical protein